MVKESACGKCRFSPWVRKSLWKRKWQPTPVFLSGKCHGERSLVGAHGIEESGVTYQLNNNNVLEMELYRSSQ